MKNRSPTVLCIMDGWGLSSDKKANAVALAKTPNYDYLLSNNPNSQLITHGVDVGLPKNQMGNSEVGHTNCLLYTSPSPRDGLLSRMPSSA